MPLAVVANATLAPPSYKALILSNQLDISLDAISHIQSYANDGLPIIFVGTLPNSTIGNDVAADKQVVQSINSLLPLSNVHHVASIDDLPKILSSAGIRPCVTLQNVTGLYIVWRSDSENGTDTVYIYNSGNVSILSTTAEFAVSPRSIPYALDAWSGNYAPIAEYRSSDSGITLTLNFQPGQGHIISFFDPAIWSLATPSVVVTNKTGSVERIIYSEVSAKTVVQLSTGLASITFNEATRVFDTTLTVPPSSQLQSWEIAIDDWHPFPNNSIIDSQITTHHFSNQSLKAWQELPGMEDVSGIGKYNTSFIWTASVTQNVSDTLGALLSFGEVIHTIRVWINDIQLSVIDITEPTVNISTYLVQGTNQVYVETASNLFNRVKSVANTTMTAGTVASTVDPAFAGYGSLPRQDYGLLGPVLLTPVLQVEL